VSADTATAESNHCLKALNRRGTPVRESAGERSSLFFEDSGMSA